MFDPSPTPRLFALPPGRDFAQGLAEGLRDRMRDAPPEAMARVEVIVNTARVQTRLREALIAAGPGFLPRIRLISDLVPADTSDDDSALRTWLELAQAIRSFLRAEPDLGSPSAAFSLAKSLHSLLDEMQGEGVDLERLDDLDVSAHSEHWDRSLRFIRLIGEYLGPRAHGQAKLRQAVLALQNQWADHAPSHPIIVAGSTGSRGPAALLMQVVAGLPQGAVVLPGFDFEMPGQIWSDLSDPLLSEDHPQFRFAKLMQALNLQPDQVAAWDRKPPSDPARNALLSLALRPAPVTDQWLTDGRHLGDLRGATQGMSLIEAQSPRQEALAIALRLRQAAVDGQKAALITPDRILARRVTAMLDRWHMRPDDSAGRPLSLSAPGRFLRQTAELLGGDVTAQNLVSLLKHPIAHSAAGRGPHLLHLRDLELHLRRKGIPFPTGDVLQSWSVAKPERQVWAAWLETLFPLTQSEGQQPLTDWVAQHLHLTEHLARGAEGEGTGELWEAAAGGAAQAILQDLTAEAAHGGELTHREYFTLLESLFTGQEVREIVESRPDIMIWGTLEARAQWADLVILAGLNDGTWPGSPQPDPWFNRAMRKDAGLLLPERQVGLSAHDFQIAAAAPQVVLSRATRDAEAETVPSRWVNRLVNLVGGLADQNGQQALGEMRARGRQWLDLAQHFDADLSRVPEECATRNPRPAPAPPVSARPKALSVTRIERLIRDPYEIYAGQVLRLRERDPLSPEPDARLRGTVLHKILETYVARYPSGQPGDTGAFLTIAEEILNDECPWVVVRRQWLARLRRVASAFVAWNAEADGTTILAEEGGVMQLNGLNFALTGWPDRIDRAPDGRLRIYDYKTGTPPSKKEQTHFAKQLFLLALMAEDGGFKGIDPTEVDAAAYVGVGSKFDTVPADITPENLAEHRKALHSLIAQYMRPTQGFTAMRAVKNETTVGVYDPLSRRGEWQPTDEAQVIRVGDDDG